MWALVDKVGTWYKMQGNCFLHVLYAKNVQEIYLEIAQISLPCNTCGAMFSTCFPHCFNVFFMWKQNECFYQRILCKKT